MYIITMGRYRGYGDIGSTVLGWFEAVELSSLSNSHKMWTCKCQDDLNNVKLSCLNLDMLNIYFSSLIHHLRFIRFHSLRSCESVVSWKRHVRAETVCAKFRDSPAQFRKHPSDIGIPATSGWECSIGPIMGTHFW